MNVSCATNCEWLLWFTVHTLWTWRVNKNCECEMWKRSVNLNLNCEGKLWTPTSAVNFYLCFSLSAGPIWTASYDFGMWMWTWSVNMGCKFELQLWNGSMNSECEVWAVILPICKSDVNCESEYWTWSLINDQWKWTVNLNSELEQWTWTVNLNYEIGMWT